MDLTAVSQGLVNAVATITNPPLHGYPGIPDTILTDAFAPVEFEFDYDLTFSGSLHQVMVTCGIFCRNDEVGRLDLQGYIASSGARSLKAAIEADKTLGGSCKTLHVKRVRGAYRLYDIGAHSYLGAQIEVMVWG